MLHTPRILSSIDGIDVPLSMHVLPFPQPNKWEGQWFLFDVQLHLYQLHFRRRTVDGEESVVGTWEDLYGKLAQVRGHLRFNHTYRLSLQPSSGERRRAVLGSCIALQLQTRSTDQTGAKQPRSVATRLLRLVEGLSPNIAPRTSFHGPIDTTTLITAQLARLEGIGSAPGSPLPLLGCFQQI